MKMMQLDQKNLQVLVKKMLFDDDMKKAAVQICGSAADSCMTDKENRIAEILKEREARKQKIKINVNMDPFGEEFKEQLKKNFNSDYITENIPGSLYVAYSVNKGEELSLCIRDKDTNKFIDNNTILFVAIHELAHIMSKSTGHTEEFWDYMKYLLPNIPNNTLISHNKCVMV